MFFTGKFHRSLDEKHRVAIPKPLREALGSDSGRLLFVAPGTDGSLAIYPHAAFAGLAERLARSSPTAREVRDFSRLFYSQAKSTRIDQQGRLRLPSELVAWAALAGEVVLIGVQDHLEVWRPASWEAYAAERRHRYDQIAEAALGSALPSPAGPRPDPTIHSNLSDTTFQQMPGVPK
jgi:MraZ protein